MQDDRLIVDSIQYSINGRPILRSISLECRRGQITGLLGRNGCGKSTLLAIIFGLIRTDHKFLKIDGEVISAGYKNRKVVYLPQFACIPGHVWVNTILKYMITHEDRPAVKEHPVYIKWKDARLCEVPGGEKKILELLFTLYSATAYALLDEPFTNLSPIAIEDIKALIRKAAVNKNLGIIVTDHLFEDVLQISEHCYYLDAGHSFYLNEPEDFIKFGYTNHI